MTAPEPTPTAALTSGGGVAPRPILLTLPGRLPAETRRAIEELEIARVLLAGGPESIGPAVEAELREAGLVVERIAGHTRYDTAALLAERGIREGAFTDQVYLVTGEDFPDALAAGAAVGRLGGSLVLCPDASLDSAPATVDLLRRRADELVHLRVVGGERAIATRVADEVVALLRERRTRAS